MNNKWVLKYPVPPQAKIRLLCFPFAGGGSSFYLGWARELEPDVEVVPVQLPGRENRLAEPALDEIHKLIAEITPAIENYLDKPYALFGHSMGSFVSFELAREIRRKNLPAPKLLMVSGLRAAHLKETLPPISHLPDEPFIEALKERYSLDASDELMELIELMLPTIRTDIRAIEQYVYREEPSFDFPIIGFGGSSDHVVKAHELEAWSRHTTIRFHSHQFEGGHFFINSKRDQLISRIREELNTLLEG